MSEPNGNGQSRLDALLVGMPWQARLILFMAMTFGFPALLALFWMGQQAGWIQNPVTDQLEQIKGITLQHDLTMHEVSKELHRQADELKQARESRQYRCVMRAKTDEARKACFPKENGD